MESAKLHLMNANATKGDNEQYGHLSRKDDFMKGYVMLPCFTVEMDENGGCEMTCNNFLGWVFETFFAPFWHGKVYFFDKH